MSCTVHLSIESVSLKNLCLSIANISLIKAEQTTKIYVIKYYISKYFYFFLIFTDFK